MQRLLLAFAIGLADLWLAAAQGRDHYLATVEPMARKSVMELTVRVRWSPTEIGP